MEPLLIYRGTTWAIAIDELTGLSATRDKLYCTIKQATLSDPLEDVTDAEAIVQIEESDGLTVLNGVAQTTPNANGSLTVNGGLDTVTVGLVASASSAVGPYERGGGLYVDIRQIEGATVTNITQRRLIVATEVTRAVT